MSRTLWKAALAAAVLLLAGCGSAPVMLQSDHGPDKNALVYGYIDMKEAPCNMEWITLRQVLPKTDKPFWSPAIKNGMFYISVLKPGAYQIDSFGGNDHAIFGNTNYTFSIPRQDYDLGRFKIHRPGVYYIGAFKYKAIHTGFFSPGKFNLVKEQGPSRTELLKRLLKLAQTDAWKARIKLAIREAHGR